mgnify:CR=1 FL=1
MGWRAGATITTRSTPPTASRSTWRAAEAPTEPRSSPRARRRAAAGWDGRFYYLSPFAVDVPLVTGVKPGELRYSIDGQVEELAIGAGFVEVTQEKVTVLTDLAVTDTEIDEAKVEEAMRRAEEALSSIDHSENTEEVAALQASIARSMAQLKLKRKRRQI